MVFRLMLVHTHRDYFRHQRQAFDLAWQARGLGWGRHQIWSGYVNGPNEMYEVLDQLFQANLISSHLKSHKKTFEVVEN